MASPISPVRVSLLFVDDSQILRATIKKMLNEADPLWEISEAGSGKEAVEKTVLLKPALVILDVNLPDMQGTEVLQHIRKLSPSTKIVMCSLDITHLAALTKQAGADAYISKTASMEDYEKTLRAALHS